MELVVKGVVGLADDAFLDGKVQFTGNMNGSANLLNHIFNVKVSESEID